MEETDSISVLGEESEGVSISLEITGSKTLIGTIESREMVLSLDNIQDLLPFSRSGVTSCRIMGADMEYDNRLVICLIEIFKHAIKIEALLGTIIVSVLLNIEASLLGNADMSGPGRVGDVNLGIFVGIPLSEEF